MLMIYFCKTIKKSHFTWSKLSHSLKRIIMKEYKAFKRVKITITVEKEI